jgi:hypothetical protein
MTRRVRRLRGALRPMTRDARLSALHRGGFGLRGRASLPGICAGSVTASSSHPGRSAWTAGSRASRGARLRAAAAGRHASLRLQVRLENTPSMSEAAQLVASTRNVVNRKIRFVVTRPMRRRHEDRLPACIASGPGVVPEKVSQSPPGRGSFRFRGRGPVPLVERLGSNCSGNSQSSVSLQ